MNYPILAMINHYRQFHGLIYEKITEELKLSQLEIDILLFLHNSPEYNTARDIVAYRGFAKSNVSNAVETLRQKGYLSVATDPDSRKVQRLSLTPEKEDVISRLRQCQKMEFSLMLADISDEEYEMLHKLMERMDANVLSAIRQYKKGLIQHETEGLKNV